MIAHFLEVWLMLIVAFLVGCSLGAALYAGLGGTALAGAQGAFADAIGDRIDALKTRFGLGPEWREGYRPKVERPIRRRRSRPPPPPVVDYADDYEPEAYEPEAEGEYVWEDEEPVEAGDWPDEAHDEEGEADRPSLRSEVARLLAARTAAAPAEPVSTNAMRPAGLSGPRNGVPDHLQRIRGIGKANEELLNSFGIFHFGQIAAWTPAEVRWIAAQMRFPETIENDDWIGQAIVLASGGDTGYVKSAEKRRAKRAAQNFDEGEAD